MDEFSLLIGGKAGDGINQASLLLARLLGQLGYHIYVYLDYPSLIRGGHNFSVVRASKNKIAAHRDGIDFLIALNQDTVDLHKKNLKDQSRIIYDSSSAKTKEGTGLPLTEIMKEENAPDVMRNSCLIGAFAKSAGIEWEPLERSIRKNLPRETDLNLKLALRGYKGTDENLKIPSLKQKILPVLSGNEAIGLGLVDAGLNTYLAYPMTPSSGILHFLANIANEFNLKVIHPENEIAVMLMALGCSYAGEKAAVGTSGGGFCLMTEGLSLSAMAELPIVVIICQRSGPSTGIPTYTAQGDLQFVLSAGHGEFIRFVVAPGDAEQAYNWASLAMKLSWKYQVPSIILSDKTLSEGSYSFDIDSLQTAGDLQTAIWDREKPYGRYLDTETGVSPSTFVPDRDAVIKVNSYEHDEYGITTEAPDKAKLMHEKRIRKKKSLTSELEQYKVVECYGNQNSSTALLCWGSNKGACAELGDKLGLKVIQPVVLSPFPAKQLEEALNGIGKIISVENNVTGQLTKLMKCYGLNVDEKILKHDGRPFSLDELEDKLEGITK